MADTIQFNADVNPAIREIDKLTKKVEEFGNKFQSKLETINGYAKGLGATLAGLGAVVASFADEIADIATANELAVNQVLAFSKALEQNGGKAANVGQILQRFSSNVESVNSGNVKLASTFGRLGVSIQDLGTLSNTELKDKLLRNLANIKDPMERNALATEIFGKAILGVDLTKFAADQEALTRQMAPYAASLQDAADAWDNLVSIFGKIKLAFAEAFNPIFKFLKDVKVDIDYLVVGFRLLGAALVVMTGAAVIAGLAKIVTLMRTLTVVVSRNPLVAIAGALVSLGVGAATYLGLGKSIEEKEKDIEEAIKKEGEAKKNVKRNQDGLNDALKKEKDTLTQIGEQLSRNWKKALDRYDLELRSLGQSEDQKRIAEEIAKIEQEAQDALFQLKQKYDGLDSAAKARNKKAYEDEAEAIQKNAEAQKKSAEEAIRYTQQRKQSIEDLMGTHSIWKSAVDELSQAELKYQNSLEGNFKARITNELEMAQIMKERELIFAKISKMSEEDSLRISQALNEATIDLGRLRKEGESTADAFSRIFVDKVFESGASKAAVNSVITGLASQRGALSETYELIKNKQLQIAEQSRTFDFGWKQAFNNYVDNATNAATQAQRIFQTLTQSMEDMLMGFFKTGKFGWRDFLQTIIDTLMRSQIQQLIAKTFGGIGSIGGTGGRGGLFGGAIIPGFLASGGPATANKPYIVGERGPELFVPNTSGTVVPNNALGASSNVTYNINAVDALSFKQMLAQDPTFLHAVAEQGRRRLPGVR